jgi:hypothetical protein
LAKISLVSRDGRGDAPRETLLGWLLGWQLLGGPRLFGLRLVGLWLVSLRVDSLREARESRPRLARLASCLPKAAGICESCRANAPGSRERGCLVFAPNGDLVSTVSLGGAPLVPGVACA